LFQGTGFLLDEHGSELLTD